jgi:hypothetical protein
MAFELPNEHALARYLQLCRKHSELPLVLRPIRDIEHMTRVGAAADHVVVCYN